MRQRINHRGIDHSVFRERRTAEDGSNIEPMKESVIECEHESMNLDSTTAITLHASASRAVSANEFRVSDPLVIRSFSTLDGYGETGAYSFIDKRFAKELSADDFHRTLEVFGMKWTTKDGSDRTGTVPPNDKEIAAFLLKFEQYEINTVDGFRAMLNDFKMQTLFEFQTEAPADIKSLPENDREKALCIYNLDRWSSFVQCLTSFRLCVPEGQHRVWILDMYMTGRFDLPYSIPSITNFTSDDAKWVYKNWRRCQLWRLTNMQVGSVWDSEGVLRVNSDTTRDLLRRAGEIITASQNRTHKMTYAEIQRGVGERFEQRIGEL